VPSLKVGVVCHIAFCTVENGEKEREREREKRKGEEEEMERRRGISNVVVYIINQ
jgi:hypothetical protein